MIPSILFDSPTDQRAHHDAALFSDVRLDTLFGERAAEILRIPCTASEIRSRGAMFRCLEDPDFRTPFFDLQDALTHTYQAYQRFAAARNECERLLSFYAYAERFSETVRRAVLLKDGGGFVHAFLQYFQDLLPVIRRLDTALDALKDSISDILTSRAYLSPIGVFVCADEQSEGLMAELHSCAGALDLCDLSLPGQRTVDLPPALAEALFRVYPEQFALCRKLIADFETELDAGICEYRHQIAFYKSIRELDELAAARGIPNSIPDLSKTPVYACKNAYDASLLSGPETTIVPNDISFTAEDCFAFLTGANGGGKTTYLRAAAINLTLALAGCPVFAESARVYPFDFIGTHFPKDEVADSGRLVEEEARVNALFAGGKHPFLFFNETFSGANEQKGLVLALECAERCKSEGVFGLFVTHFHGVNGHGFSVLSTVVEDGAEHKRSYKIAKNTGLRSSFAEDVLRKYRLDADSLRERRKIREKA